MIPIEYRALLIHESGETNIDIESPGWLSAPEFLQARAFTLYPKEGADLPTVSVHLDPLPDGTPKRLVYFSRPYGQMKVKTDERVSEDSGPLFRLYCLGWSATVAGREVRSVLWVYPGGSVVFADEPPYVDTLVEHYAAAKESFEAASR